MNNKRKEKKTSVVSKKGNKESPIENQDIKVNKLSLSKKEFFEIYDKAKKQQINIETLDADVFKGMLLMIAEEMRINSRKIDKRMEELQIILDNCKIYNRQIESMKKPQS